MWGSSATFGLVPEAALWFDAEAGAEKTQINVNGEEHLGRGKSCLQSKIQNSCCMKYSMCAAGQKSKTRIY